MKILNYVAVGCLGMGISVAPGQMLINGAGATFPYPLYSKWFDEYAKIDPSVRFNYQSIGSGGGQQQIIAQTVDFGASDGPMSDDMLASGRGHLQFTRQTEPPAGRPHPGRYLSRENHQVERSANRRYQSRRKTARRR